MQPTPNPTLLNGHAHHNGNGHASLLPEGGGAAAGGAAAEGAPSPTASTPSPLLSAPIRADSSPLHPSSPPSSTASLRHSVPASLPHEDLLLDYLRRDYSLIDLARTYSLSLQELIAWSQLPSTRASLEALRTAAAERDATHAAFARRRAIDTLSTILETFAYEETHEGARETPLGAVIKWRRRETARRAATTLLRLTGTPPAPPREKQPSAPAPSDTPPADSPNDDPAPPHPRANDTTPSSTDSTPTSSLHHLRRARATGFPGSAGTPVPVSSSDEPTPISPPLLCSPSPLLFCSSAPPLPAAAPS